MFCRRIAATGVGLTALCLVVSVPADEISVRADEWYPVNGVPEAPRPGFAIELLSRIWADSGYSLDYRLAPWQQSIDQTRRGEVDCIVGAYRGDAPDLLFPEQHLIVDQVTFFVRDGEPWRYQGLASLEQTTVAVIEGYAYGEPLDSWLAGHQGDPELLVASDNNALEDNIRALLEGRVDVLVESTLVMSAKLEEMNLTGRLTSAGTLEERNPVYVACSPAGEKSREYLELFDQGMEALRESGELEEILERYSIPAEFVE